MAASEKNWISVTRVALQESQTDFFRVSPTRYWFDFLLSLTLAYGAARCSSTAPMGSLLAIRRLSAGRVLAVSPGVARA